MTAQTHRFNVADFYRMGEAGILRDDNRVELLDGEVNYGEHTVLGPGHDAVPLAFPDISIPVSELFG